VAATLSGPQPPTHAPNVHQKRAASSIFTAGRGFLESPNRVIHLAMRSRPIGLSCRARGRTKGDVVVLLLALLLVLIFFGAGFALHILWIVAVVLLVLWVIGFALGRGEGAGKNKFYRW
jgi:hypothetical protein